MGQELGSGPCTSGSSKTTEARSEDPPGTLGPAGPPLLGFSQETCGRWSELGSTPISWKLLQQRPQQGLAEALSWDACFLAHRHEDGEGVSKLLELFDPRLGLGRDRVWGAAGGPVGADRTEAGLKAFGTLKADTLWPSEGREDHRCRAVGTCGAVLLRGPASLGCNL